MNQTPAWAASPGVELVPLGYNPASRRAVPRERESWRPWVVLRPDQREQLLGSLPPRERLRAVLLFHLGVRLGVVLSRRWEQVDWQSGLIAWTSKGKSGLMPMNKTVRGLLERLHVEQGSPTEGALFPVLALSTLRRHWSKARAKLGLPRLRRHDLRVTFARELHARGASLRTIQSALGHATPTMTIRYIPADLEAQRKAVASLDDA